MSYNYDNFIRGLLIHNKLNNANDKVKQDLNSVFFVHVDCTMCETVNNFYRYHNKVEKSLLLVR